MHALATNQGHLFLTNRPIQEVLLIEYLLKILLADISYALQLILSRDRLSKIIILSIINHPQFRTPKLALDHIFYICHDNNLIPYDVKKRCYC